MLTYFSSPGRLDDVGDMPPMSRKQAATYAAEEVVAYAVIRAWMADDFEAGQLIMEQHKIPPEGALLVLSLVKASIRALLSVHGYQVDRALEVIDQWLEDAGKRAAA